MSTVHRLHGSLIIARHFPGQLRMPYRDPEQVARIRDRRVRSTVRHAAAHVPHYRDLFRREGIDPREIRTADDLARLPLVTKADVQREPRRFVAETRAGRDAVHFRTSGSTGTPLDVWHDRASLLANIGYSERQRAIEVQLCERRVRYTTATLGHPQAVASLIQAFYAEASLRPVRPGSNLITIDRTVEAIADALNRLRPDIVKGYGTYLELLFRTIDARGLALHPPSAIVYGGDGMSEEGRAFITDRFGIPVVAHYAAVEALKIALLCEHGAYHLHDDLCHVRTIGGEVVISNLVNRATVLLNYGLGDGGEVGAPGCECGRTTRVLTGLAGRANAALQLPDGVLVNAALVIAAVKYFPEVLRYQLVQVEPTAFELRLTTVDRPAFERVAAAVLPELRLKLGGARVEAAYHEELPDGRKFALIVPLVR